MLYLDTENKKPIQLYINCTGGDVRGRSPARAWHGRIRVFRVYNNNVTYEMKCRAGPVPSSRLARHATTTTYENEVSQLCAGCARIDAEHMHDADHASDTQMLAFCRTHRPAEHEMTRAADPAAVTWYYQCAPCFTTSVHHCACIGEAAPCLALLHTMTCIDSKHGHTESL